MYICNVIDVFDYVFQLFIILFYLLYIAVYLKVYYEQNVLVLCLLYIIYLDGIIYAHKYK